MTGKQGVTLVELLIAIVISSLVVIGTARVYGAFVKQNAVQRKVASLNSEMVSAIHALEKDTRMAGYGLPGNGLQMSIAGSDDTVWAFSNEPGRAKALLAVGATAGDSFAIVAPSSDYSVGSWVLLKSGSTLLYRNIKRIESSGSNKKLVFTKTLGAAFTAGSEVYYADGVQYYLKKTPPTALCRIENGDTLTLGTVIDSFAVAAQDSIDGSLSSQFEKTRSLIISVGGNPGTSSKPMRSRETIRVNIRNYL
jgi:prepilin-type N-terminal cleavage/methylation domain-containing protein